MNVLPLVILFLLLSGDKLSDVKNLLAKIDFKSFAPILKILGVNDKLTDFISSDEFSELVGGDLDLKKIIGALSAFGSFGKKETPPEENSDDEINGDLKLDPIKDVASTDIEENLGSFFS